jgi:nitrous oxidase accessory protein
MMQSDSEKDKMQTKPTIVIILILISALFTFPEVEAETKTIVVPNDYSTIQEAINKAADGDKVFVKKGIYLIDENNTMVISSTLSLIGEDPVNTIIIGASNALRENGIAIRLAAPNVTVSGFTLSNFRVAIAIVNYNVEPYPSGCKIVNNNIINNSEGIRPQRNDLLISENNITKNNAGITGYNTENVVITRNNISENEYGVNIGICRNITVSENHIFDNSKVALNLYYFGPHFVYNNIIANNGWGIRFAEGCGNATVYGNYITQNGVGIVLLIFPNAGDIVVSGVGNMIFGNLFINNTEQVSQEESSFNYPVTTRMGTDVVSWDNSSMGNFWSNYSGTDSNGDRIGDMPYVIDADNQDNYPLMSLHGIAPTPSPEPTPEVDAFSTALAVASVITLAIISVGLLVYFKKRKH